MQEEITETTVLNERPKKGASFWANFVVLSALVAMILWAQQWAVQKAPQPVPAVEEEIDKHIVLEDLETQKPLAEPEQVVGPKAEERTENREQKTENRELKTESRKPRVENRKQRTENRKRKTVKKAKAPVVMETDPYTDGGVLDLDRLENRKIDLPKKEATATPPLPQEKERGQFIPFE